MASKESAGWRSHGAVEAEVSSPKSAHGIIIKNTFIDICPPEESDSDDTGCMSPHRRNVSAPPSPTRQRNSWDDSGFCSDPEEEDSPGSIPIYKWSAEGGIFGVGGDPPRRAEPDDSTDGPSRYCADSEDRPCAWGLDGWAGWPPSHDLAAVHPMQQGVALGKRRLQGLGLPHEAEAAPAAAPRGARQRQPGPYMPGVVLGEDAGCVQDRARGANRFARPGLDGGGMGGCGLGLGHGSPALTQGYGGMAFAQPGQPFGRPACISGGLGWSDPGMPPLLHGLPCGKGVQDLSEHDKPGLGAVGHLGWGDPGMPPLVHGPLVGGPRDRCFERPGDAAAFTEALPPSLLPLGEGLRETFPKACIYGGSRASMPPEDQGLQRACRVQAGGDLAEQLRASPHPPFSPPVAAGASFGAAVAGPGKEGEKGSHVPLGGGGGPKRTDYLRKYGPATDQSGAPAQAITTMMLKNIPCRKSQEEVMLHIDRQGFGGRYDFFYLPRDVKFRANLGYAFINFATPEDAARFQAEMNGYRFSGSGSNKACVVVPAHVQGLMNNLAAFKRTEVMRSSRKPYFSGTVTL